MPLKKSAGNMYPWVSHTHSHLGGECPHRCVYCYVDNPRFGRPTKYTGALRLLEPEFAVNYGKGKTIFVEHMNDLFAEEVPAEAISRVLGHCAQWPNNRYVFQTKNPDRINHFPEWFAHIPTGSFIGSTLETNRETAGTISKAPEPPWRFLALCRLRHTLPQFPFFLTLEPLLDFDVEPLVAMVARLQPAFVNIGADSKNHGLPEPTPEKVHGLLAAIKAHGIEIREKHNLTRLLTPAVG